MKKMEFREQRSFVNEVMKKIQIISELDNSPDYALSLKYYKENGTLEGIEDYLKMQQK